MRRWSRSPGGWNAASTACRRACAAAITRQRATRRSSSSREAGSPNPVLTGVKADGRLDGVLFELALRQTYRNTSEKVLEVVYTFPLPHQAVPRAQ